ncbi:MAG: bifunctional diaminohydroxyphosphoribosylaminopyrimidine deaminase/5-amino-6-(5-phosphoribosylamino)uracil reductase RibD, partial [Bacteroidaceae bacterium]|nr:bifunctional diaminohydroxyphosphoribosylaminopyrimidine deaminase/5-amino-6-(5-phosphoribosylamino)uracil reductase RibD [Bacteroidaceae bacterium]
VIVWRDTIIGEGYHRQCGKAHAEVNAIASVKDPSLLKESTIYVSLEPCAHYGKTPPCADLIIKSGIPRVIIGCADPFAKVNGLGIKKLRDSGCEVKVGVLESECLELNHRFFTFHKKHRPWITLKWAQSKDGFIGACDTANRVQFSNAITQTIVHRLRAKSSAILVGTRTAILDNPSLTTRYWAGANPLRLTIDRKGCLPENLRLLDGSTPTIVYTQESIEEILNDLYDRNIQSLIVEGGACLLQSFIDAGLWDEARIETAPVFIKQGTIAPKLSHEELKCQQNFGKHSICIYRRQNI